MILALAIALGQAGQAQSGLLERLKEKVKNRAEQRTDEAMDKGIDKAEDGLKKGADKKKKTTKKGVTEDPTQPIKAPVKETARPIAVSAKGDTAGPALAGNFKSYSRFDFVPGDNILYSEDFSQDVIGEFPLKWYTNNRGETVKMDRYAGQWLRMFHGSQFVSPQLKRLPDNFTLEFDLVLSHDNQDIVFPILSFRLFEAAKNDGNARIYFSDHTNAAHAADLNISPGMEGSSTITMESTKKGTSFFNNDPKRLAALDSYYGRPIHFSISVQKQRLRLWMEEEKVYDIPNALPQGVVFDRLAFFIQTGVEAAETLGYYISNIKLAEGAADMRSKLITEGKLVTNGILFDVNAAIIKAASYPVIKEIATVLKENPAVRIKIIGHTDSDGDGSDNLQLSKRRAAAVREALISSFGIDAARLETDGKGETEPAADNKSPEGKLKNRRVEFIKLNK